MPAILVALPFLIALLVWITPLSFVPVPWPDDSAFYFVAHELFRWPPRWVMLPQAPFEPTYADFNFNTMPLYPLLIGVGRWFGIDGSHALKLWPLSAWAASLALLGVALHRQGLPRWAALLLLLGAGLDPELRWASVLLRPESLIGLLGVALVLGLTYGFPARLRERGLWHPVAALLALGAYAHFNAVHLVFPVLIAGFRRPREIFRIGATTTLYLAPWLAIVLAQLPLFTHQMTLQWSRLAVGNAWLAAPDRALRSLFQEMGSPVPFGWGVMPAAGLLWALIALALGSLLWGVARRSLRLSSPVAARLAPASGWVLGSLWLWHTKPEVWFVSYIHLALWTFAGIGWLETWRSLAWRRIALAGIALLAGLFLGIAIRQASELYASPSWRWSSYRGFVDCIDRELVAQEQRLGNPRPYRVWVPTWPDVLIELARRHPDWSYSRTNDFMDRSDLALKHGRDAEAVVVTETIQPIEIEFTGMAREMPERLESVWMTWRSYFLNRLYSDPRWRPEPEKRRACMRGRWHAYLFLK